MVGLTRRNGGLNITVDIADCSPTEAYMVTKLGDISEDITELKTGQERLFSNQGKMNHRLKKLENGGFQMSTVSAKKLAAALITIMIFLATLL